MKKRFFTIPIVLGLFLLQGLFLSAEAAKKPVDVVIMTTPFGSSMYNIGAAFEQVFKKSGSWVHIKHQETAGAMYMYRYAAKNREKMKTGEVAHTIIVGGIGSVPHLQEGRWPFKKIPWPTTKTLVSTAALVGFYGTFDPKIKTTADFAGKRVCTQERARVFLGLFLDKPLFGKGLGIYKQIKWAPLGDVGCKDALLNGKVDVTRLSFGGMMRIAKDGTYVVPFMAPSPTTLEIMSSGRDLHMIPIEPDLMKRSYDFSKDIIVHPSLIKKGAVKGLKEDIWARAGFGLIHCDAGLPDDIVEEIVRVRHEHR
ncbi:MAG: hypothetical protein HOK67_00525, partial [Deltaproteobacteria bacterium]|nr:hypothetical protein [Deltaproteobacteria bacterium]